MSKKRKRNPSRTALGAFAALVVVIGTLVVGLSMHNGKVYHSIPL